jgi:predicted transcriptional regulator YdeE
MTNSDFGGQRQYHTDFEIYDSRASDPANAVIDIYIGIGDD